MAYRRLVSAIFQRFFLIIFFLALAGIFGILWWLKSTPQPVAIEAAYIHQPAPTPGPDLTAIENDAEIKIPASARNIHAYISGAQAIETWVRLDLPAADLAQFLASAKCQGPLAPQDPKAYQPVLPNANPPISDWWQPQQASRLEGCSGQHDFLHQSILVDKTKKDVFTIYVFSATDDFRPKSTRFPQP